MPAWDRTPNESDRAWAAFQIYLGLGPDRSFAETARRFGCSLSNVKNHWCYKNNWASRACAYDKEVAREAIQARVDAAREAAQDSEIRIMREEVSAGLESLKALLGHAHTKLLERLDNMVPEEIPPSSIPGFMRAIAHVQSAVTNERASLLGLDRVLEAIEDPNGESD